MKTVNQYIRRIAFLSATLLLCQTAGAQSFWFEIWPGTVCSGRPATVYVEFSSSVNNDTPVTYYVYRNGYQYSSMNSTEWYFDFQMPGLSQGDQIKCEVTTRAGNRYVSNTITVQISQPVNPYVYISTGAEWDDTANQPVFCPGSSRTMTAYGNGSSYQWYRNGSSAGTSASYTPATLNDGDMIRVEARVYDYCNNTYRTASDQITVQVRQNITPAVTLTSNAAANICPGTAVKFTAAATGVQYPSYTWYKNDKFVTGAYTSTYTATDLVNGDRIRAQVYSYGACVTEYTTNSNTLTMQMQTPQPLTVSLYGTEQVCRPEDISVYAYISIPSTQINSIDWSYNGETGPYYNVSTDGPMYFKLRQGVSFGNEAVIKCHVWANSGTCLTSYHAESNSFTVTLKPSENNYVSIYSAERGWSEGGGIYETCSGQSLNFTASAAPATYSHTYSWYLNGYQLPGNQNTVTVTEEMLNRYEGSGNGENRVKVTILTNGGCLTNRYKESGTLSFRTVSAPSAPPVNPAVAQECMKATLTAPGLPSSQSAYWQTSATGESFTYSGRSPYTVSQPGTYYLRSYGTCWGEAKSVTVTASQMAAAKPAVSVVYGCNRATLKVENPATDYNYFIHTGAESTLTSVSLTNTLSENKIYYVRGLKGMTWGCPSDPVNVNIPVVIGCDQNYIRERVVQTKGITDGSQITATNALASYTYFDGLGRPMQTVAVGASPDGMDIVTPVEYDAFGREAKKYLPYTAATGNGSYKTDALGTDSRQAVFYKTLFTGLDITDANPWSDTDFEPSPLNRVIKQVGPGNDWQGSNWKTNGKRKVIAYRTNTSADTVKLWVAYPAKVVTSKPYDAGMLYVTEMTDEDDRVAFEYKDMQDRVVRQRQLRATGQYANTDFCYDDFGRLAFVIPPAVTKSANLMTIDTVRTDPWFQKYVYAYRYDARGRETEKHIPGAGWTWTVYNKLDMPVAVQDAEQRSRSEWSFIRYDAHGRVVMTGLLTDNAATQAAMQAKVDAVTVLWETRTAGQDYPGSTFPASGYTLLSVSYYDDYEFPGNPFTGTSDHPHGLPTGGKVRVLGSSPEQWLFSAVYYDQKGRVVRSISRQPAQGGTVDDETVSEYDFTGRITRSERKITTR